MQLQPKLSQKIILPCIILPNFIACMPLNRGVSEEATPNAITTTSQPVIATQETALATVSADVLMPMRFQLIVQVR